MSASEWIQLFVHPDDAELQRLSELTGRTPASCLACVLRWFWHVDRKQDSPKTGLSEAGFHQITRWRSGTGKCTLAAAMQDSHVGWLEMGLDGMFIVPKFEEHFGRGSKRRAMERRRKMSARHADKSRTDCAPTTTTTTTVKQRPPYSPPKKTPTTKPKVHLVTAETAWDSACAAMKSKTLQTPIFREAWTAWVAWCLADPARKSGYTIHALKAQVRKLERMGHDDAITALENATGRWQGIFEPSGQGSGAAVPASEARPTAPAGKYVGCTGVICDSSDVKGGADGQG